MIFLTVGSALPFDRLVKLVDDAVAERLIAEPVYAQIGSGRYVPKHCEFVRVLPRSQYDSRFGSASAVISHAGIGTISAALKVRKPLMVMPRLPALGELVDDHQLKTAKRFTTLGHVLMFEDLGGLVSSLSRLANFVPQARCPNVEGVAVTIGRFLSELIATSPPQESSTKSS